VKYIVNTKKNFVVKDLTSGNFIFYAIFFKNNFLNYDYINLLYTLLK